MDISRETKYLYDRWQDRDNEWMEELRAEYGDLAQDFRYDRSLHAATPELARRHDAYIVASERYWSFREAYKNDNA